MASEESDAVVLTGLSLVLGSAPLRTLVQRQPPSFCFRHLLSQGE